MNSPCGILAHPAILRRAANEDLTMMLAMFELLGAVIGALRAALRSRTALVVENLALRQQLSVLRRQRPRPHLRPLDRTFWVLFSRAWSRWAEVLAIVKPATVVAWHRRGFDWYWTRRSRRVGRPPIDQEIISLIERMTHENPTWSRRRIANELAKLGYDVNGTTVAKYMPERVTPPRQPSISWKAFVRTQLAGTIAVDFLTVHTVTFNILYAFVVLSLDRRRILHINVTAHPCASWAAQQIIESIGFDATIVRLIRDRDRIYGSAFDTRVEHIGIRQVLTAPRSPWQNGFMERLVGTLRREMLDHVIVLGERHLLRLLREFAYYYNNDRPHMSLDGDAPVPRAVEPPESGSVVALPRLGGLHHRYTRKAAA
jgi:transposase InsO family protein